MNEDWLVSKQQVIEQICKTICKSSLAEDLAQEVSIYFLTHELPEVVTDGFIYTVAFKMFHLSGSSFKRLHIDDVLKASTDIEPFCLFNSTDDDKESSKYEAWFIDQSADYIDDYYKKSIDDQYEQVLKELTPMEQIWVEEIMKRNCSISLFSQHTSISRQKAKERMNEIYNKLRDNARD